MPAEVETLAYVRDVPWHGLGTKVDGLMTAREALVEGELDWTVSSQPIYTRTTKGRLTPAIPGRVANVRDSDGAALGIVTPKYQIVQNAEAFDFADSLVDSGAGKYETVGSLFGGQRVFLSMELPEGIHVPGDEGEIKPYILITNGHDGVTPLAATVTPVRVVCANTWTLALEGATRTFKIRHTGSIDGKLQQAREALDITFDYLSAFGNVAEKLVALKVSDKQVDDVLGKVFPMSPRDATRIEKDPDAVVLTPFGGAREVYRTAPNLDPIRGTGWGLLQAVGEYLDHEVTYHGRKFDATDVRMDSILYDGPAAEKKQKAYGILSSLAK